MKLNYQEITPCLKITAAKWEELLNKRQELKVDRTTLTDLVKAGKNFNVQSYEVLCHEYSNHRNT